MNIIRKFSVLAIMLTFSGSVWFTSCSKTDNGIDGTTGTETGRMTEDMDREDTMKKSQRDNEMMEAMNNMMDEMDKIEMTGDADYDFAKVMLVHHEGSMDLAREQMDKGEDEKLRAIAERIIDSKKKDKEKFKGFLDASDARKMEDEDKTNPEMMTSMNKMRERMKTMKMTGNTDHDFAMMMINHHEDGIEMARNQVRKGTNESMKKLARELIDRQEKEIQELRSWMNVNKMNM